MASLNSDGASCQVTIEKEEELVLFSNEVGPLSLNLCSLSIRTERNPGLLEVLQRISDNDPGELLIGKLTNRFGGLYFDSGTGNRRILEWPEVDSLPEKFAEQLNYLRAEKISFETSFWGYTLKDETIYWIGVPR